MSAYSDALRLLSRREVTVADCRSRLLELEHSEADVDLAIARLIDAGSLNDARFARTFARTAVEVKGRGRLRVQQELQARGVSREIASEAVGEVFGDKDERALVTRALQKKLRGKQKPPDQREYARLYQHLMRQGFTPAAVIAALREVRGGTPDENS
jgi:regulatory protein